MWYYCYWGETMIQFYRYNSEGRILSTGYCPENMLQLQEEPGIFIAEGVADFFKHYVEEGVLIEMPSKPNQNCIFNYQTKQWEDPRTLQVFKDAAYKKIEEWRNQQENQTFQFTHEGRQWDAGLITRQRIQPVLGLSQLPEGFFWTDAANVDVPVTMASLQALAQAHEEALVIKGFEIHSEQRALKNAVEAATSKEAVESIVIGL